MFAIAFYLLRDGGRFTTWAGTLVDDRGVLNRYAREVDESFDTVFYGNILNAIITGIIGAVVFSLLNVVAPSSVSIPYAALTGLLAGAASLIPVVGMKLVYVPMTLYLGVLAVTSGEGGWFVLLFAAVSFVLVDVIPDLLVRPYVSGGKLHTGALMFAYILGPLIWGWYGIFLGPVILVLFTHFARVILPEVVNDEPIEAAPVDPATLTRQEEPEAPSDGDDAAGTGA